MKLSILFSSVLALGNLFRQATADIGLLSFWVPELYVLLDLIRSEGQAVEEYVFGGRKFYVTTYKGHKVVAVNTGVGLSNAAATTAILLQKFPSIDRIIGSGIAGGVNPSLNIGDVVIPARWALYHEQHFAKEKVDGTHEIPEWAIPDLWGTDCGIGQPDGEPCALGLNTWNYTFMYPQAAEGASPSTENVDHSYGWFDVDSEMLAVAETIAPTVVLENSVDNTTLSYEPKVVVGGNGVSGPTYVDNAEYRNYAFNTFQADALDMETAATAHVAAQFGVKCLFFRSLSDLAGGEDENNSLFIFFRVAAANAVATLGAFLEALPVKNVSPGAITPTDHTPGDATQGLLGVLSFWRPELEQLKAIMEQNADDVPVETVVFAGRTFYHGRIAGADVVATLTGVSITNAAMTTALMAMLFPGVERIVGGGIAGGVDPALRVGDVVIPERWAMYQMQTFARDMGNYWMPPGFELGTVVGIDCGGWNGIDRYLVGDDACNMPALEASNFGMILPKTIHTPDPNWEDAVEQTSEGVGRKWWFEVDPDMYQLAKEATQGLVLEETTDDGTSLPYTPEVFVGGNGISGPTFVDNAEYREYLFTQFDARCVDMETAAAAHVAYQMDIPVLFFRSLSDLAGADQDGNVMSVFFALAAKNAFTVTYAVIEAMYPIEDGVDGDATDGDTSEDPISAAMDMVHSYWNWFLIAGFEMVSFLL
uniref:Nucleoside phosphorylase domain-containing protein n=1 Tax=Amphora coffeiformis TaxID=265554 RepID=A0A7S3LES7_9STRA